MPSSHRLPLLAALLLAAPPCFCAELPLTCDPPPVVRADQVLVPLAFLRDQMGCATSVSELDVVSIRYWGHAFSFEIGKQTAYRSGKRLLLQTPPERLGEHVYLPLKLITDAVGFRFEQSIEQHNVIILLFPNATLQRCRVSKEPERVRIVYDLSSAVPVRSEVQGRKLLLTMPARPALGLKSRYEVADPACSAATLDLSATTQVRAGVQPNDRAKLNWFTLSGPARVVVDVNKRYEETTTRTIAPGIAWSVTEMGTGAGPMSINVARVDLANRAYELRPVMAGDEILTRHTTSYLARRANALVAVNGGFFSTEGAPLGLVVIDRELVRTPVYSRTSLGITKEGEAHIGRVAANGYLLLGNGSRLPVTKLNGTSNGDGLYLFTRWWDEVVPVSRSQRCLIVSGGKVVQSVTGARVGVPAQGYLAVGTGYMAGMLAGLLPGSSLSVRFDTEASWASTQHALGAGPMLVRNGREFVSAQGERFRRDVTVGRSPRTAVGVTQNQFLLLVTVDGRNPSHSVGMTLRELARYMIRLGAHEAMNLDGGGSTSFVVGGRLRNRPSGGAERRVSNVLAVVPAAPGQ